MPDIGKPNIEKPATDKSGVPSAKSPDIARPVPLARPLTPAPINPGPAAPPVAPAKIMEKPPGREQIPPTPASRSRVLPVLYFLGFAILAGAIAWMWQNPPQPPQAPTGVLQAQLDAIDARLTRLEARPSETRPGFDPAPLLARIAALEARPSGAANPPAAPPDLAPIEARIATLEARPATSPADVVLGERIGRIARIQAAGAALDAGRKLGDMPGAPPALRAYADTAPPTEAALRLAFPAASRAALVASRPIDPDLPWLSRIWGRLQELVTIRQGDRVLVGDPAAGVVASARQALDAGDLAGAVAALGRLNPPAAQAMSGWIDQAKALLEARAALAEMAARAAASPTAPRG